jgi:hypothetical protein
LYAVAALLIFTTWDDRADDDTESDDELVYEATPPCNFAVVMDAIRASSVPALAPLVAATSETVYECIEALCATPGLDVDVEQFVVALLVDAASRSSNRLCFVHRLLPSVVAANRRHLVRALLALKPARVYVCEAMARACALRCHRLFDALHAAGATPFLKDVVPIVYAYVLDGHSPLLPFTEEQRMAVLNDIARKECQLFVMNPSHYDLRSPHIRAHLVAAHENASAEVEHWRFDVFIERPSLFWQAVRESKENIVLAICITRWSSHDRLPTLGARASFRLGCEIQFLQRQRHSMLVADELLITDGDNHETVAFNALRVVERAADDVGAAGQ